MSEARPIRDAVETLIFGTETRGGSLFDVALLITILASVTVVMLDSMDVYHAVYGDLFRTLEISFTLVFTVEYLVRLWCLRNPVAYAISFWGVIDLLAILPTFLTLFVPDASSLIVIRVLRVLRVFRILHLFELHEEVVHNPGKTKMLIAEVDEEDEMANSPDGSGSADNTTGGLGPTGSREPGGGETGRPSWRE